MPFLLNKGGDDLVRVEEMPALRLQGFTDSVQTWRLIEVEPAAGKG